MSMEIRRAAQVVVLGRDPLGLGRRWCNLIAAAAQDVAHMAVVGGAEFERDRAGRFQPGGPVALDQAEQAQAAAVAVLGMTKALQQLRDEGMEVRDEDVARLSPLVHHHITFQGRYSFALSEAVARGELRPLRDPDELDY